MTQSHGSDLWNLVSTASSLLLAETGLGGRRVGGLRARYWEQERYRPGQCMYELLLLSLSLPVYDCRFGTCIAVCHISLAFSRLFLSPVIMILTLHLEGQGL